MYYSCSNRIFLYFFCFLHVCSFVFYGSQLKKEEEDHIKSVLQCLSCDFLFSENKVSGLCIYIDRTKYCNIITEKYNSDFYKENGIRPVVEFYVDIKIKNNNAGAMFMKYIYDLEKDLELDNDKNKYVLFKFNEYFKHKLFENHEDLLHFLKSLKDKNLFPSNIYFSITRTHYPAIEDVESLTGGISFDYDKNSEEFIFSYSSYQNRYKILDDILPHKANEEVIDSEIKKNEVKKNETKNVDVVDIYTHEEENKKNGNKNMIGYNYSELIVNKNKELKINNFEDNQQNELTCCKEIVKNFTCGLCSCCG